MTPPLRTPTFDSSPLSFTPRRHHQGGPVEGDIERISALSPVVDDLDVEAFPYLVAEHVQDVRLANKRKASAMALFDDSGLRRESVATAALLAARKEAERRVCALYAELTRARTPELAR
jgi:hypothetical protein